MNRSNHPAGRAERCMASVLGVVLLLGVPGVRAADIVVGQGVECTTATIQAAIDRANSLAGHHRILVTDDTPGGVHTENLRVHGLREDLTLEIVGGFADCASLEPNESGMATLEDSRRETDLLDIEGHARLSLRALQMIGGRNGVRWRGHGRVVLTELVLEGGRLDGISVTGSDAEAEVELTGGVEVRGHGIDWSDTAGIHVRADARLIIRGDGNRITENSVGIRTQGSGYVDIGATGPVISDNRATGLVLSTGIEGAPPSRVFSTDPANPLRIVGNRAAAIYLTPDNGMRQLCMRNVALGGSRGPAITAWNSEGSVEWNGAVCSFPAEADVACAASDEPIACNRISAHVTSGPLVLAARGARVALHRVLLTGNTASAIAAVNPRSVLPAASEISLSTAVVRANTVTDALFDVSMGGSLALRDATVFGNSGSFGRAFSQLAPAHVHVVDSIIDQTQDLIGENGTGVLQARFDRVLAGNRIGAPKDADIVVGMPHYASASGHLATDSAGVDHAPAGGGVDLDGNPRDVDTLGIPNVHGPRDLGAFEVQAKAIDAIFAHGFD